MTYFGYYHDHDPNPTNNNAYISFVFHFDVKSWKKLCLFLILISLFSYALISSLFSRVFLVFSFLNKSTKLFGVKSDWSKNKILLFLDKKRKAEIQINSLKEQKSSYESFWEGGRNECLARHHQQRYKF